MISNDSDQTSAIKRNVSDWVQVDASLHYDPMKYLRPERMASIGYQFRLLHENFPEKHTLEVGAGAGLTTIILRQLGHEVHTLDVDEKLSPDLLGSITDIPSGNESFDSFLCCQVLEHLPWQQALVALQELARVSRRGGVISVPTIEPCVGIRMHGWGRYGHRRVRLPTFKAPSLRWPAEHYWELGSGVTPQQFRTGLKTAGFEVAREIRPPENLYHHFFVVRKMGA